MPEMTTGFYYINHQIHYGSYPKNQISGKILISMLPADAICTGQSFSETEYAVTLYDNHAPTEFEIDQFRNALDMIQKTADNSSSIQIDFSETESRLGTLLPPALIYFYNFLVIFPVLMAGKECFLPPEKLYIDNGNLVFYKAHRTPVGISMKNHQLMRYSKKEWHCFTGDENYLMFMIDHIVPTLILDMPCRIDGMLKNPLKNSIHFKEEIQKAFADTLQILEEYVNYENIILFNENHSLAWITCNGCSGSILVGSDSQKKLDKITRSCIHIEWAG